MKASLFLTPEDVAILTAKKRAKQQILVLRQMGIPHFVNAAGRPIVCEAAITGQYSQPDTPKRGWKSNASTKGAPA